MCSSKSTSYVCCCGRHDAEEGSRIIEGECDESVT